MQKDLNSYIKIYKNFVPEDIREQTIAEIENLAWEKHKYRNYSTGELNSPENTFEVLYSEKEKISTQQVLMQKIWDSYHNYVTELNFPWYTSWQGFSSLRFNKYSENTLINEHCDHVHSIFSGPFKGIPILSAVCLLNDNFEGGEFVMFTDEKLDISGGDMIVFPSVFLYPHRVNKVIKGKRYSFSAWNW